MSPPTSARDRIIDSAIVAFAERGPIDVTLDELRAASGTSVGAVYHHFADKGAILEAARLAALERYQAAFTEVLGRAGDARAGVEAIVRFHVRWCGANRHAARLLLDGAPRDAAEANRAFFAAVRTWWRPHVRYGTLRDLDLDLLDALWIGPATAVVRGWLVDGRRRPSPTTIATLAEAAWMALKETP